METNLFEEILGELRRGEYSSVLQKFQAVFSDVATSLAVQNTDKIVHYSQFLNMAASALHNQERNQEMEHLLLRINEYLFILHVFMTKNINIQMVEELEEVPYSMLVLESLKHAKMDYQRVKEGILGSEPSEEEETLRSTLNRLRDQLLIEEDSEGFVLADRGKELFSAYSKGKKMTNKYERVRRQQISSRNVTVNIELLEKIEKIKGAFHVLEAFYNSGEQELTTEYLLDELEEESSVVTHALEVLKKLYLVDMNENETTYIILSAGENVFKTYRKNKRFTNKFERLKRTA